jgi:hypothetical protein
MRAPGGGNGLEVALKPFTRSLTLAATAALVATVGGGTTPQHVVAAQEQSATQLERSNEALRAQLRRERARTTRLVRLERRRSAKIVATYRRQLRRDPSVNHALQVAAATYGVPASRLKRVAMCESRLQPTAQNGRYLGIFQFGSVLWNATPYRAFSRTDPYASALAASWAFKRGMSSHWPVCGRR